MRSRDAGLDRMPFASFAANSAWLELVLAGADLLAWLRVLCLEGELTGAEPKTLAIPARTPPPASSVGLGERSRLPALWPWAMSWRALRRVRLLVT